MKYIYSDLVSDSDLFEISGDIVLSKNLKFPQYPTKHKLAVILTLNFTVTRPLHQQHKFR
jgi:hypothetical protein